MSKSRFKCIYYILFFITIQFSIVTNSVALMLRPKTELYFLPEAQKTIGKRLTDLIDSAQESIFIAVYWLTDPSLIKKLIEVRKKGIDVQIVVDESTFNFMQMDSISLFINKLINNDIKLLIFPSKVVKEIQGIMHNKFIIVDLKIVWTGSGNFTKSVLSPKSAKNNENILIFHSPRMALDFMDHFKSIKDEIEDLYIDLIATTPYYQLPSWLSKITHSLKEDYVFSEKVKEYLKDPHNNHLQKTYLKNYLNNSFPKRISRFKRSREDDIQDSQIKQDIKRKRLARKSSLESFL